MTFMLNLIHKRDNVDRVLSVDVVQISLRGEMGEETEHHTGNHHLAQWRSRHLQAEGHASLGECPSQQGTQITPVSKEGGKGENTLSPTGIEQPQLVHG